MKISAVIPTTGKRNISKTLKSLNSSTVVPEEIIIVTLDNSSFTGLSSKYKNVKVINADKAGQVNQRIQGFKIAKGEFILQLDDDIVLDKKCIRLMLDEINNLPNAAISPNVFQSKNNESIFDYKINLKHKIFNLISGLKINNKQGKITLSGFESYSQINTDSDLLTQTDWLIGGCVMHHKNNLVLDNYFPFEGKAYSEDLFHSIELRKKIKLYIHKRASIFLELNEKSSQWRTFKKDLIKDAQIRKHLVLKNKLSITRMYFVYLFKIINYFIK